MYKESIEIVLSQIGFIEAKGVSPEVIDQIRGKLIDFARSVLEEHNLRSLEYSIKVDKGKVGELKIDPHLGVTSRNPRMWITDKEEEDFRRVLRETRELEEEAEDLLLHEWKEENEKMKKRKKRPPK
jgi:hypothetical protein